MKSSLKKKGVEKLKPRFYGPYKVVRKVGEVANELELPEESKNNNVFHVSNLKKTIGKHIAPSFELPPLDDEGLLVPIPERILRMRERKLRNRVIREYLVKWKELPMEDATIPALRRNQESVPKSLHHLREETRWMEKCVSRLFS